jgi:hypothetical protein
VTNIIKFPGAAAVPASKDDGDEPFGLTKDQAERVERMPAGAAPQHYLPTVDGETLTDDQAKAIALVLSGNAFVTVGVFPTKTGADFLTALHGKPEDLRAAEDHLPGVIGRLFVRKGVR